MEEREKLEEEDDKEHEEIYAQYEEDDGNSFTCLDARCREFLIDFPDLLETIPKKDFQTVAQRSVEGGRHAAQVKRDGKSALTL